MSRRPFRFRGTGRWRRRRWHFFSQRCPSACSLLACCWHSVPTFKLVRRHAPFGILISIHAPTSNAFGHVCLVDVVKPSLDQSARYHKMHTACLAAMVTAMHTRAAAVCVNRVTNRSVSPRIRVRVTVASRRPIANAATTHLAYRRVKTRTVKIAVPSAFPGTRMVYVFRLYVFSPLGSACSSIHEHVCIVRVGCMEQQQCITKCNNLWAACLQQSFACPTNPPHPALRAAVELQLVL